MSSGQSSSLEQMLGVYKWVVDDVVSSMKDEFLNESVDLQVLEDLKQLWEQKLVHSGALSRPQKEVTSTPKSDSHEKSQKKHQKQQQKRTDQSLSVIQHTNSHSQASSSTVAPPPPLINLQNQTELSTTTANSSRVHSSTSSSTPRSTPQNQLSIASGTASTSATTAASGGNHSSTGGVTTISSTDLLAQAQLYSAMAGMQPLMLPTGGGPTGAAAAALSLPMLPQGYAAVQTPTGLSYVPFPVALNLSQQQQSDSRNKDPSNNISQNDGPLPVIPSNPLSVSTVHRIHQLDGANGDSSSEESDDSSESEPEEEQEGEEDDPLNSDDDAVSDGDDNVWDTDNTIVCQFEKVYRVRAKWKFALKDGIMNLKGHDYIFNRVNGEAEW